MWKAGLAFWRSYQYSPAKIWTNNVTAERQLTSSCKRALFRKIKLRHFRLKHFCKGKSKTEQCWATPRDNWVNRSAIWNWLVGWRVSVPQWSIIQLLALPSTCEVSLRKLFQKPLESAEFLDFVIERRSANHSWRPSSNRHASFL